MANSLQEGRFKSAEYARTIWTIIPDEKTTEEDLLRPAYWAHVAKQLKAGDLVEVRPEDGTYFAVYYVLITGRTWAKMHPLHKYPLVAVERPSVEVDGEYLAKWRGPKFKWSVIRLGDNSVLKEELETKDEALKWIVEHNKSMSR